MRFLLFNSAFIIWFFSLLTHLSSVLTPPRTFIIGGQEVQLHWFWDTVTRIIDKTLTVSDAQVDRMLELVIMYALILLPVMFISAYLPRIFKNRKTKDYGSAAWATKSELRRNGLIGRYGIIFGQCHEARYKEVVDKKDSFSWFYCIFVYFKRVCTVFEVITYSFYFGRKFPRFSDYYKACA